MKIKQLDKNNIRRLSFRFKTLVTSILVLGLLLSAQNIWAHASLVKSDPPRRATLSESPSKIQLWFNEEIEAAYATVSVVDMNDKIVSEVAPEAVVGDAKSLTLKLPVLASGAYKVQFRVLSIDGHVVDSSFSFRIKDNSQ